MMKRIKALIIDDELPNRELIANLVLKTNPHYHICGSAENCEEAFKLIHLVKPDVIFLDIKMPGGSGFDLLRKFEIRNFEVVFITGFDEYAIQAFEFNALDYVLKPIDSEKLKITLQRVVDRLNDKISFNGDLTEMLNSYDSDNSKINKIPVHYKDKVILIEVKVIVSVQSDKGYTIFKTRDKQHFLLSKPLCSLEFIFNAYPEFCKINKGAYINTSFVKSYSKGVICSITMVDETVFEASRRKKREILQILDRTIL